MGDFIGLDTVLSIMNVLYDGLADSKYRPCPLLTKYVEAGWLGKKSGRGFYDYRGRDAGPHSLGRRRGPWTREAFDAAIRPIADRDLLVPV